MHDESAGRPAGRPDWRQQFAEEARAERADLALMCLLVGAEADPSVDEAVLDAAQIELDRLAGLLPFGLTDPHAWATALAELLGGRCDFGGSPADYQRLESSLLHEVLRRRRGLPILLSVVWIEVARRAGAPVYGVALPGHFVVGFGDPEKQVLADPFAGGRVLTGPDAELLVAGATGAPMDPSMLLPADPVDVVVRILNNIRAWAATRPERSDVALWAVELSLLLPSHPARLRYERAQLLVQRGEFLTGAAELDAYADVVAAVDQTAADTIKGKARAARAMLN
ncbi:MULTISPECIES: transglutaminase-like domain-containing protein [unclassified Streptomyces]|uniref:transglutaminase-like domain-containing protein n=1 Tax=unclassified Streptomyces TaxID=2593676 RepID=UPI002DDBC225|nr:transglutaminase-like domain-containing protein [Streptomyces sp. NBC_01750]WSB00506.1 transglutaminase-like domain-containing protein [Streptomyces sp. NBC_01794]WSD35136.1 transglutaminase-like domain-containing protein [Streptomyces sp. NBC_01750]